MLTVSKRSRSVGAAGLPWRALVAPCQVYGLPWRLLSGLWPEAALLGLALPLAIALFAGALRPSAAEADRQGKGSIA